MRKVFKKVIGFILVLALLICSMSFNVFALENLPYEEYDEDFYFPILYPGNNRVDENGIYRGLCAYGSQVKPENINGRPYFEVDTKTGVATFYGGDENNPNRIKGIYEGHGSYYHLTGITFEYVIERIVFTTDFVVVNNHIFKQLENLKEIVFLNDAKVVNFGFSRWYNRFDITVYGSLEEHKTYAEEHGFEFRYLDDVELCTAEDTTVSIDSTKNLITGLTPKTGADTFVKNDLAPKACDAIINSDTEYVGTGDKVNLVKWLDDSDAGSYDILLYGDVDGDGIYDARDAYLVNLMANGILTEEQVGSLKWSAADCNHDGEVNASDVLILEQAGLMLANVDQTKSGDELQEDAAFTDYVELIDQNPATEEPTEQEAPAQPTVFEKIVDFIKYVITLIKSFLVK